MTWNLPASDAAPVAQQSAKPEVKEAAWQPPPPPIHAQPENKSLATASMIVGILSMACLGSIPAIIAIVLGGVALSQIKKTPAVLVEDNRQSSESSPARLAWLSMAALLSFTSFS